MNEQYIDTIHRYLSGAMDGAERETFESQLRTDPKLQNDVELERLLLGGLEHAGEKELRKTIGAVHQKLSAEGFFSATPAAFSVTHLSKTSPMKRILAIAATFVLLAGAVWFFSRQETTTDHNALFAQYFKPEQDMQRAREIIPTLKSLGLAGTSMDGDTLRDALQLYADGNFEAAEKALKSYLESNPDDHMASYYLGATYMNQAYYAKAIEVFFTLSKTEFPLQNDALWNLGLCYLKAENSQEDAREAFIKLANDNNYPNHRGAKAVLDQLLPKN